MAYQRTGPDFRFCGQFNGKDGQSAGRWLKKFDWEMSGYKIDGQIPPKTYLEALDLLLIDEAAIWAESTVDIAIMLSNVAPTQVTVDQFRNAFTQKYPSQVIDVAPISFDAEMSDLKQASTESLLAYYKRVLALMNQVGAKDRPRSVILQAPLTSLESAMLDTIIRSFIRGIIDEDVKCQAFKRMGSPERSLLGVYTIAEEARRTKIELQKFREEEMKTKELDFYKTLVKRNMGPQQLDALLTSFHSGSQAWSMNGPQWAPAPPGPPPLYQPSAPRQDRYQAPQRNDAIDVRPPPAVRAPLADRQAPAPRQDNRQGNYNKPKDPTTSKNQYVNGSLTWESERDGPLCVNCGSLGHGANNCPGPALSYSERSVLKTIVFRDDKKPSGTVNYASYGYDYDQQQGPNSGPSSVAMTPSTSNSSSVSGVRERMPRHALESRVQPPVHSREL